MRPRPLDQPRASLDVDIDVLEANRYQPRARYDDDRARRAGTVDRHQRRDSADHRAAPARGPGLARQRYQIIAGERRWRAAQRAGLQRVPVVVKDVDDADHRRQLEMALVENIQRENLNPIEEAAAYQRLVDEFQLRQEDIATPRRQGPRDGGQRAPPAEAARGSARQIASGELSMGHARAILGPAGRRAQRQMAREVIARGLSVRETEALVKRAAHAPPPKRHRPTPAKDVHTRAAEEQLRLALGTDVTIHRKRKGGPVEIAFGNEDELQRIYEYLTEQK